MVLIEQHYNNGSAYNPAHYALELAAAGNQAIEQPRMHQPIPHTHARAAYNMQVFHEWISQVSRRVINK